MRSLSLLAVARCVPHCTIPHQIFIGLVFVLRLVGNVELDARNWFRISCDLSWNMHRAWGLSENVIVKMTYTLISKAHTNSFGSCVCVFELRFDVVNKSFETPHSICYFQKHLRFFFGAKHAPKSRLRVHTHVHYQLTFLSKTIKYENKTEQLHRTRSECQFRVHSFLNKRARRPREELKWDRVSESARMPMRNRKCTTKSCREFGRFLSSLCSVHRIVAEWSISLYCCFSTLLSIENRQIVYSFGFECTLEILPMIFKPPKRERAHIFKDTAKNTHIAHKNQNQATPKRKCSVCLSAKVEGNGVVACARTHATHNNNKAGKWKQIK